jgi:putative transcriptional regulator
LVATGRVSPTQLALCLATDGHAVGSWYGLGNLAIPMNNKLRVLRAERKWSQADLADKLGVSRQTINAIETGKYDPSLPLAFKIARLFQQPIEQVFFLDDQA